MATLIPAVGAVQEVQPAAGTSFTLDELHAVVGGYIEIVRIDETRVLVLNEEGKLIGLPVNPRATVVVRRRLAADDYIAGDTIVCTLTELGEDADGDDL